MLCSLLCVLCRLLACYACLLSLLAFTRLAATGCDVKTSAMSRLNWVTHIDLLNFSHHRTCNSLVMIGQETAEIIGGEKKGLNTGSISQWPSASRMTGGHNKTGKADHTAKKFSANIPHIIGNLHSKFGDNWFIFKEVTTKRLMDPRLTAVSH